MSDTTRELMFKSLDGQNVNRLRNWLLDTVTTDPVAAAADQLKLNTADNRLKLFTGGALRTVAYLSDLSEFSRYRGAWDASTGIPTAAGSAIAPGTPIEAGDRWLVTVAGTITGLTGESEVLAPGDFIVATADGAATAAQFAGIQSNVDTGPIAKREVVALAALPADTATAVAATTLTAVDVVSIRLATGEDITSQVMITHTGANTVTLQSSVALTNLAIRMIGAV